MQEDQVHAEKMESTRGVTLQSGSLDSQLGYALLRLTMGLNLTFHSFQRYKDLHRFVSGMVQQFVTTPLPSWSVTIFASSVPFVEPLLGILILLGLGTRWALSLGALFIAVLVFGTALRGDFQTLSVQLIYAIVFFLLLMYRAGNNRFSLDEGFTRR